MADAWLYEVRMARGTVYALRDIASGKIWTERSEHGARELARERRLSITVEQSISHEELLRLLGHEPIPKSPAASSNVAIERLAVEAVEEDVEGGAIEYQPAHAQPPALTFPVRYHLEDEPDAPADDADVISWPASQHAKGVFCSDGEITPKTIPEPPENSNNKTDPK